MNISPLEYGKFVFGSPIIGALATTNGDCDYVSLKGYQGCIVIIAQDNATTVTGAAITLKQATAVAGTSEKALAFTTMYALTDAAAGDTNTATAVTSNTFTTDTTDNKNLLYLIDVKAESLDMANGFDCIRVDSLLMANAVGFVGYYLYGPRYQAPVSTAAITD